MVDDSFPFFLQRMELLSCSLSCSNVSLQPKIKGKKAKHQNRIGISTSKWISEIPVGQKLRSEDLSCGINFRRPHKILNCYVADRGVSIGDISSDITDSKILIPGFSDEVRGKINSPIRSGIWEFKPKFNVHYERSGEENVDAPAVLFLPGFGVGSFHYKKQLRDLGREYRVWALDFLGQGRSLPFEDPAPRRKSGSEDLGEGEIWGFGEESEPWAEQLVYSIDLWQEQVSEFIDQVPQKLEIIHFHW